jgi:hypothetical protein
VLAANLTGLLIHSGIERPLIKFFRRIHPAALLP